MKTKLIYLLAVVISILLFSKALLEIYKRYVYTGEPVQAQVVKVDHGKGPIEPVFLKISSININTQITSVKDSWAYPDDKVVFLKNTPLPGNKGNSVIYGHNFKGLFGELNKVMVGDLVEITLSDGTKRSFKVTQKYTVTPDQTHILSQTKDTRLTLFTCAGFLDSKRLVVLGKLVN